MTHLRTPQHRSAWLPTSPSSPLLSWLCSLDWESGVSCQHPAGWCAWHHATVAVDVLPCHGWHPIILYGSMCMACMDQEAFSTGKMIPPISLSHIAVLYPRSTTPCIAHMHTACSTADAHKNDAITAATDVATGFELQIQQTFTPAVTLQVSYADSMSQLSPKSGGFLVSCPLLMDVQVQIQLQSCCSL